MTLLLFASTAQAQAGSWAGQLVGPRARRELRHPEAEVRLVAAGRLAVRGESRRAVAALLEALATEEEDRVRQAIFRSLSYRGDRAIVRPLASGLTDWSRADRAAALATLGAVGGEEATRVLVEWLGASDVGDDAMDALVEVGAPAVPHLVRALGVPAAAARAARTLGRIGDTRAIEPLVRALRGALPAVRAVIVDALGEIGDERAAPAVARLLVDPAAPVVAAALRTLGRIAGPAFSARVVALADRGPIEQRARALRALGAMDPSAAAPRIDAVLRDAEAPAVLRHAAMATVLAHPVVDSLGSLRTLLDGPGQRVAAAEALARVPRGAGMSLLLEHARRDEGRALDPALAVGIRRHMEHLDSDLVEESRAHLRRDPSVRGTVLSALAQDVRVVGRLLDGLASDNPAVRATAALGAGWLGPAAPSLREEVAHRLMEERDAGAFRALASAALALRTPIDPARIDARWWDAATAPEALWLAATHLEEAAGRTRTRARQAMRRSLRSAQPRVRAGAALALAIAGERSAWRALLAALDDEHDAVRLAAARALWALSVEDAAEALAARARVEPEADVRAVLRAAARLDERTPPAFGRGREILYVHVVAAPGLISDASSLSVDVLLPDGRWLRVPALEGGVLLLPDLPAGQAEVQVQIGS